MVTRPQPLRTLYVVAAAAAFLGCFPPLYTPRPDASPDSVYRTMNVWTAIGLDSGGFALLAVAFVILLALVAGWASVAPRVEGWVPSTVLVLAVVGTIMLIAKPGSGSNPPSLGAGGELLLGTCVLLVLVALTDLTVLMRGLSSSGHRLASAAEAHSGR